MCAKRNEEEAPAMLEEEEFQAEEVSPDAVENLRGVAVEVGGAYRPAPGTEGAVGFTHFDTPASEDNVVTILVTTDNMSRLPSQALIRIRSLEDERDYLGVIVAGPFAEPDGLRADSPIIVATTMHGKIFLPRYHGRAFAQILGEEAEGEIIPPRYRPRPNSPVFPLDDEETTRALRVGGDARLGVVVGRDEIKVEIPTTRKDVLARHTGILGTTGGGKSTTVSRLVFELQKAGIATVIIDVEGEYTEMDYPTDDPQMQAALRRRGLNPGAVEDLHVFHLVGRETSREAGGMNVESFCLKFSELSPYAVTEILDMPEAQEERFHKAYAATQAVLRDLKIFPATKEEERQLVELDELESGYPGMTISYLLDIAGLIRHSLAKEESEPSPFNEILRKNLGRVQKLAAQTVGKTSHELSWLGLIGRLGRINRLKIFDNPRSRPLEYQRLIAPGRVSVVDLSDTDEPQVRNLAIAELLRGVQRAQEQQVQEAKAAKRKPTPVVVIIEEAHEFLSAQRIRQMPVLFRQVASIAKRGRKRWLGLVFVTQLPQHLPDEVLGLINNYVLHKIADSAVVAQLRRSISGLDRGQWDMLPGLAPGMALISLTSMTRPLLVSVDPAPCRLLLAD